MKRETLFNRLTIAMIVVAFAGLLIGPATSVKAEDCTQQEYIDLIDKGAREIYQKYKGYGMLTKNMTEDQFVADCIGIAKYEHRDPDSVKPEDCDKWKINEKSTPVKDKCTGKTISTDYGVMQVNDVAVGEPYFTKKNLYPKWKTDTYDNIRAGCTHLADGFNEAYNGTWTKPPKPLQGQEAIEQGLQSYNPGEEGYSKNVMKFICCPEQSTNIELISFTAKADVNGNVTLTWETATEQAKAAEMLPSEHPHADNAGFNLYRARGKNGKFKKMNASLIPATGNPYSYQDTTTRTGNFFYKLEDVDINGVGTMHDPIKVKVRARH